MSLEIKLLTKDASERWDAYVQQHPRATFFHRAGWMNVIEKAFGHETAFLYAEENGAIRGLLPLARVKSLLFGDALVSTPFCVYGGAIADNDDIRSELESRAEALALEKNVDYLELRNLHATRGDWPEKELYVTFRKEIDPDPEVNMLAIPRKQRAMVRKGIKAGLQTETDSDIERFFGIYALSVRNHGTPVFAKNYFRLLKQEFADDCEVRVVVKDGSAVSTVMSFYFRDEVLPYYGGGTLQARRLKAFDFMYWDLMKDACEKGIRYFDYGRSKKGTGSYSFKKNWGFEPQPLAYQFRLVKADTLPDINPLNPKYQLFIKAWQKLPLPVANTIGPMISRYLG